MRGKAYNSHMSETSLPTHIPQELAKYFWDVKPETVNPATHPYFVINRLLDKGGLDAARWVVRTFPKEMIIETLKTVRDFSPWNGRFWTRYYQLKEEDVACLRPSYRSMRSALWPY